MPRVLRPAGAGSQGNTRPTGCAPPRLAPGFAPPVATRRGPSGAENSGDGCAAAPTGRNATNVFCLLLLRSPLGNMVANATDDDTSAARNHRNETRMCARSPLQLTVPDKPAIFTFPGR